MVDVDHFKTINDSYGHERGDDVLRQLAQRLETSVRPGDIVCRVGGEEFLLLMPGLDVDAARFAAERINGAVASAPLAGLAVTVSVGMTSRRGADVSYQDMVRSADAAMYRAKQEGRNCVRYAA